MHAAEGILTSTGGMTSHAAVVARGMGKCCVAGAGDVRIDGAKRTFRVVDHTLGEGDVGMENYLRTLDKLGYAGPLTIEREIPQEPERQKAEIGRALALLRDLKQKIG